MQKCAVCGQERAMGWTDARSEQLAAKHLVDELVFCSCTVAVDGVPTEAGLVTSHVTCKGQIH